MGISENVVVKHDSFRKIKNLSTEEVRKPGKQTIRKKIDQPDKYGK